MLKRPDFVADLNYKTNRKSEKEKSTTLKIFSIEAESNTPFTLTAMWNTDGLQIFNTSSFSLWPFFLVINELPPHKRFMSENILIAGIWGSVTKPHPDVYLLPIYKDVKTLEKGFECNVYGEEEKCIVKLIVLCGTCDAPARALFINMKSHSGYFSCPVCLCRGERSERTGDVCVFPYEENVRLRFMGQYKQQKNRVLHNKTLQNEEAACGIKGPSVLSHFVKNIFKSTSIDGMHCIYLGVTRQMLLLMTEIAYKDKDFSIHGKIPLVSKRMLQMSPPHFVQRLPQSLEKLILWKASELRTFLLYYALCVLLNILPPKFYDHLMLLVEGISLLNKSSVSSDDIKLSSTLLNQFVAEFQELYGIRHMSHNLHMVIHLPHNVQNLGPLWATSCFKFEDMNGRLTNLVHGTRHVGLQVYSHLSVATQLPLMINNLENESVKIILLKTGKPLNFSDGISKGVHCIGNMTDLSANFIWIVNKLLEQYNIVVQPSSIKLFFRLLKNNLLFLSTSYTAGKRVSSFVKYSLNNVARYGVDQTFAKVRGCNCTDECDCSADYVAVVKPLELTPCFGNNIVTVHHIYSIMPADLPEEIVYIQC
ncbi:LOW QUALITY PROTEIN: putative eukaryotic translation initiation factor 5 [Frankliniella fusca]|uniref:Eukaryotic translation initiation factor 5 n=1 Tax=Frankliniella fusca TaxID=407009 RepID=A0AAE1LP89_9NEOP|nr:LOW QUALITY PROTEIN: putative eukaryotic translation initiation factor 5 [Frankliniella fusca]